MFWLMQPRSLGIGGSTQLRPLRLFGSSQLPLCRWLALHHAKSSFMSIQQPSTHRSVCAEVIALCMSKASCHQRDLQDMQGWPIRRASAFQVRMGRGYLLSLALISLPKLLEMSHNVICR